MSNPRVDVITYFGTPSNTLPEVATELAKLNSRFESKRQRLDVRAQETITMCAAGGDPRVIDRRIATEETMLQELYELERKCVALGQMQRDF